MSWTEEDDQKENKDMQKSQDESLSSQEQRPISNASDKDDKLWTLLEKTLHENVIEKRRARRWKIFFRFITLGIVLGIVGIGFSRSALDKIETHTNFVAVIPMRGVIGSGQEIDSSDYLKLLDDAYKGSLPQGVVIEMNSPGGSPVQAGILYDAIREKEKAYPAIPIIVVVEDMAASGGYYIASAANEIYADKASLVGSIGVISSGFDASGLLERVGVERRVFTAGRNKAFLDPFTPMTKEAKQKWQSILDETHQQFISAVKQGRGQRLIITDDVFSGMVFTGTQALKIGLIDGLSNTHDLLKRRFPNAEPVLYEPYQDPWEELAKDLGVQVADKFLSFMSLH